MPGVEGLVHISELAQHHVENPREVVSQGDHVKAKIIEVDAERRRLSLSLKRVEGDAVTQRADDSEAVEGTPNLDLSEEVFPEGGEEPAADAAVEETAAEVVADEPAAEAELAEEPAAEEPEPEPQAAAEPSRRGARARAEADAGSRGAGARGRRLGARSRSQSRSPDARVACPDRSPSPSRAASGRGRARPSPRSRARAQPPSRATRSCHRLLRDDEEVREAVVKRFGDQILDGDGEIDRARAGARSSSPTARRSTGSRTNSIPG